MENWLPIPGFEGRYEVSSEGRVRGPRYGLMTPQIGTRGYLKVTLRKDGKQFSYNVNTLVLRAFRGERPLGLISRHLNSIKTDNRLDNLEWNTQSVNCRDKPFANVGPGYLKAEQVREIRQGLAAGVRRSVIAKQHGLHWASVHGIYTGKYHRGTV